MEKYEGPRRGLRTKGKKHLWQREENWDYLQAEENLLYIETLKEAFLFLSPFTPERERVILLCSLLQL